MSYLQDASQIPVPVRTPAISTPTVADEPVRLCDTCQKAHYAALRDDDSPWIQRKDHVQFESGGVTQTQQLPRDEWPELPRLFGSAQAGCAFCAFLREAILSDKFNDAWGNATNNSIIKADRKVIDLEFYYGRKVPHPRYQHPRRDALRYLIVRVTFEENLSVHLYFELEADPGQQTIFTSRDIDRFAESRLTATDHPGVAEWLVLGPPTIRNYENGEIASFLTTELQKCSFDIEDEQGDAQFLPARLIDVGVSSLRLVERGSINPNSAERPQYCALSYCWGPPQDAISQTRLMRNNLQQYTDTLDFCVLSPVLKDAVKVARSLSIPYLWVDCLCILQDDISDWQRQCSQMNDIYGKARVTLIATSSRTCKEGFLRPKRHELRFPYQSARRPDIKGFFMMNFTHAYGEVNFLSSPLMMNDVDQELVFSQWGRRGWTFQEEAMAGARIVFGALGVYFGRQNQYVSKDGPAGLATPKSVSSLQSNHDLHRAWRDVLCRYSAFTTSSFTNPADALPALSGLARLFGKVLQVNYFAGHWADKLHCTLLWVADSKSPRLSLDGIIKQQRQRPPPVPTWSGLTCGKINYPRSRLGEGFPGFHCQSEITILDVSMPAVGDDPYGAIQHTWLNLEGFVLNLASLSWTEFPKKLVGSWDSDAEEICFEENAFDPSAPNKGYFTIFDRRSSSDQPDTYVYRLRLDFQFDTGSCSQHANLKASFDKFISRVTILLVGYQEPFINNALKDRRGYGLVLVPLEGASQHLFVRVGTFYPDQTRQYDRQVDEQDSLPSLKRLMRRETIKLF